MKLSAFFSSVNTVLSSYSLPWLGMIIIIYLGVGYAGNRLARGRRSAVFLYGLYAFALFFVLALIGTMTFDALLKEPVLLAMIAALCGAGIEVYRRATNKQ